MNVNTHVRLLAGLVCITVAAVVAMPGTRAGASSVPRVSLYRYFDGRDHESVEGIGLRIHPGTTKHTDGPLGQLDASAQPGTHALYECLVGWDYFTSRSSTCEGYGAPIFDLGYAANASATGLIGLYRCTAVANGDHFDSVDPHCEGQHLEGTLGWLYPQAALNVYVSGDDHSAADLARYGYQTTLGDVVVANANAGYPAGTHAIYECVRYSNGYDYFTSTRRDCGGAAASLVTALGGLFDNPTGAATVAIRRCVQAGAANGDHFDTTAARCPDGQAGLLLGYALPEA